MRISLIILCSFIGISAAAQSLNLTSLQHEVRWLDESRFPPFVTEQKMADSILLYTASALAGKFQIVNYSKPSRIDYRFITMFGKPKMKAPGPGSNEADYQASVLSFLTRGTSNMNVLWSLKAEIIQNGKTIYSKEIEHQLVYYGDDAAWFTPETFIVHYKQLFNELLGLSPALAYKYILGDGVDYTELLKKNSEPWDVIKKNNPFGFGSPSFGPFHTILAQKMDTAVFKSKSFVNKETTFGPSDNSTGKGNSRIVFNQYKIVDINKTKFCQLQLSSGTDTTEAIFAVDILRREARKTVLGELFGDKNDNSSGSTIGYKRDITGRIDTDTLTWDFAIENYNPDGSFARGYLVQQQEEYVLQYKQTNNNSWETILKKSNGEYIATLYSGLTSSVLRIKQQINPETERAIATFYAVMLSVKNVQ